MKFVPNPIQYEIMIPTEHMHRRELLQCLWIQGYLQQMESCWRATRVPRMPGGASSALNKGTTTEIAPTPRPVTKRPAASVVSAGPAILSVTVRTIDIGDIVVCAGLEG